MISKVTQITYPPIGMDKTLQRVITDFMNRRLTARGSATLGQLGYFHMSSIMYVKDHLEVKVYFHPDLSLKTLRQMNNQPIYIPDPRIDDTFNGYLFVGELKDAISFERATVPAHKIVRDATGQQSLRLKDGKKPVTDMEVVVLQCNLSLTMAAAHGISLDDPNFKISYETIVDVHNGRKAKAMAPSNIATTIGSEHEFPVSISIQFTDHGEDEDLYNPELAVPYLLKRAEAMRDMEETKRELANKVSDDAAHLDRKRYKQQFGAYLRYR